MLSEKPLVFEALPAVSRRPSHAPFLGFVQNIGNMIISSPIAKTAGLPLFSRYFFRHGVEVRARSA
jgi:hypothetical protein